MTEETKIFWQERWRWALMLVTALVLVWLWMSWRYAWFPFSPQTAQVSEQTLQEELNSLTAPETPTSSPASALKELTPPPSSTETPPADDSSILDSLTPPQ